MKITGVETIPIRVPLRPDIAIRSGRGGAHTVSPFLIVKLHSDEGFVGLGEVSCTPRWSGEDQFTAAHFIDRYFAPLLIDQDPVEIPGLSRRVFPVVAGNFFTKSGIEMALWDLLGRARGVPVSALLGGAIRDSVPTKWSISGVAPEQAAEIARGAIERGFRKLKVKVGIDPDGDVVRVRAVREAAGDSIEMGVDANGGWGNAETATATIKRLKDFDIRFVEQPVPAGDIAAMAEVRRAVGLPIIADESVYSLHDARALAHAGACDVFSIYIGKAGGIGPAMEIAAFASGAGIACTIGSNLELGVGSAAMAHVAAVMSAVDAERYPCDIIGPFYYEDDVVTDHSFVKPGWAGAPMGAGLGVELDEQKIKRYRVRA